MPIIIAGGSFNAKHRETRVTEQGIQMLEELIKKIDNQKAYFVIGHKVEGYEKALINLTNKLIKYSGKKFKIWHTDIQII